MKKLSIGSVMFLIPLCMLWVKTYIVQKTQFHFPIKNAIEEFILFFNTLAPALLFFGIAMIFPKKAKRTMILLTSFMMSFVLYANVVFYRSFNDFITIPLLFQKENMSDLGSSIQELMKISDLFMFTDVLLTFLLLFYLRKKEVHWGKKRAIFTFIFVIVSFCFNLSMTETQRTQLLTRTFDREILVKYLGVYSYHVYDIALQTKTNAQRSLANEEDINETIGFMGKIKAPVNNEMTGIAEGKNLILISLESVQSFVINKRLDGQEITPFINSLIENEEVFYFDNLYHQVGQGRTSDAEFIMDNSLYPLSRGAVFFTHPENHYVSLTKLLKDKGYYTGVFHANNESFWNRNVVYKTFGTDKYYSETSYEITKENSIGWGLKDIEFFEQTVPMLKEIKQPFYAKILTLTNHFPFTLQQKDELIPEWTTNDGTVNRYFTTVRYADEALKIFFEKLKESGLYENSVIVIYGDHFGISENHHPAMGLVMGREITDFEYAQLQRVPLLIHIPGLKGKVINDVAGQIDVRPTILNLFGISQENLIHFGDDLFSQEKDNYTIFRDGSVVTEDYLYTQGTCYSKDYGLEVSMDNCFDIVEFAKEELRQSDRIIYGDLLRFQDRIDIKVKKDIEEEQNEN